MRMKVWNYNKEWQQSYGFWDSIVQIFYAYELP